MTEKIFSFNRIFDKNGKLREIPGRDKTGLCLCPLGALERAKYHKFCFDLTTANLKTTAKGIRCSDILLLGYDKFVVQKKLSDLFN